MAETASGMLNAVGLQNKGVDYFIENIYPKIKDYNTTLIVNVNGSTVEEYIEVTEKINELDKIPAIELNISCPNVKEGGMSFGISCPGAASVTREVRRVYDKTLIVKLSPNVTDISEIAKAVEARGQTVFLWSILSWEWQLMLKSGFLVYLPLLEVYRDRQLNPLLYGWSGRFTRR
jgi:dihydroorotate dehydrogenase (NAD+) catalytic subunit